MKIPTYDSLSSFGRIGPHPFGWQQSQKNDLRSAEDSRTRICHRQVPNIQLLV